MSLQGDGVWVRYQIRVEGELDAGWSGWFGGLTVRPEAGGVTLLDGPVRDQAALHGLLAKIRDLGLPLVSVQRVEKQRQRISGENEGACGRRDAGGPDRQGKAR